MKYYQIKPSKALAGYVKFFWIGEVEASILHQFTHLSIATSSPQIIFHYKGQFDEVTSTGELKKSFSAGVQGPSKKHAQFVSCENVGIFGIELYPYAIPCLFSNPATALTNRYIDIETFLGNKGRELQERIFLASTNDERVGIANAFLESLVKKSVNLHIVDAVHRLNRSNGLISTDVLLKHVPYSQRQFERLFKDVTGFTPKLYGRILRFEEAINNFRKKTSFTEIALDAGYFDQAHFNRDFREFTGLPPKDYLKVIDQLNVLLS